MKSIKNILAIAVLAITIVSCKNNTQPEVKTVETAATKTVAKLDPNATYVKAEFGIEGMTCAIGCAKTIEKKLSKMEGVKSVTVDFDKELAMVEYDQAKVTPTSLEETVTKTGDMYKVKDIKTVTSFSNEKMACKADCKMACCANKTEAEKAEVKTCDKDCKKACCTTEKKA